VADLDNDGSPEVIFTSWPAKTNGPSIRLGKLHILSAQGLPLYEVDLPGPKSSGEYWNGALAAPTLANIDGDPNLEIVVNTVYSGIVAYEVPDSANARIISNTGRSGQVYQQKPARTSFTNYFDSISDAYADLPDITGGMIQAWEYTFVESPILGRAIPVTLVGGFNASYSSNSGYTTVDGVLTVAGGSLTIDRVVIR
jgi:hypothetical protein